MRKPPLATIALTAAVLLAGYAALVQFAPFTIAVAQNQNATNLIRVQDFLWTPDRPVLLVGSSLTFRLPKQVLGPDIANLALAGDGPRTGLRLLRDSGAHPRLVLVESNLLLHPVNDELIRGQLRFPDYTLRRTVRAFRTGYDPINLLWRGLAVLSHKSDAELPMPPDVARQLAARQYEVKAQPPDSAQMGAALADTRNLVRALERRGIKVGFLEMPIDPGLMHSPFDQALRRQTSQVFLESHFCWIRPQVPGGARTLDGIHLVQADAALVAGQIARMVKNCG